MFQTKLFLLIASLSSLIYWKVFFQCQFIVHYFCNSSISDAWTYWEIIWHWFTATRWNAINQIQVAFTIWIGLGNWKSSLKFFFKCFHYIFFPAEGHWFILFLPSITCIQTMTSGTSVSYDVSNMLLCFPFHKRKGYG